MEGVEIIDVALEARLDTLAVAMCTVSHVIADVRIKGNLTMISIKKKKKLCGVWAILHELGAQGQAWYS